MSKEQKQLENLKKLSIKREQIKIKINDFRKSKRNIDKQIDDLVKELILSE